MLDNVIALTRILDMPCCGDMPLTKIGKVSNRALMGMPSGRPDPKRLPEPDKSEEKISKAETKRNKRKLRNISLREKDKNHG